MGCRAKWRSARRSFCLAAAAAIVVAATAVAIATAKAVVAAPAEQDQQDDDPAHVTAKTVVTHREYLRNFVTAKPFIPWYSAAAKMCSRQPGIHRPSRARPLAPLAGELAFARYEQMTEGYTDSSTSLRFAGHDKLSKTVSFRDQCAHWSWESHFPVFEIATSLRSSQ